METTIAELLLAILASVGSHQETGFSALGTGSHCGRKDLLA
jgi:hypothetical protein